LVRGLRGQRGATRTPGARNCCMPARRWWRPAKPMACKPLTWYRVSFQDLEALRREARFGGATGLYGQAGDPSQPGSRRRRSLHAERGGDPVRPAAGEAFEMQQARGAGAFALDGRMIDMPLVRSAPKRVGTRPRSRENIELINYCNQNTGAVVIYFEMQIG